MVAVFIRNVKEKVVEFEVPDPAASNFRLFVYFCEGNGGAANAVIPQVE